METYFIGSTHNYKQIQVVWGFQKRFHRSEAAIGGVLYKKVFLNISQNSRENACARVSFLIKLQAEARNFIKKEALAQVHSCEFCEISKNTFFTECLWETVS